MRYYRNKETGEIHRVTEAGRSLGDCNLADARKADSLVLLRPDEAAELIAANPDKACAHCAERPDDE